MKPGTILLMFVPLLIAAGLIVQHQTAQAQRPVIFMCNGVPQGHPNCPPPVPVLKNYHRIDRSFGALAYDEAEGIWFGGYQYPSKSKAKKGVLAYCRENGGTTCKLMLSYTNQCAAVARAVADGVELKGRDTVDTGSTQEEAEANANASCKADWGVQTCSMTLVNCSHHAVTRWQAWEYE